MRPDLDRYFLEIARVVAGRSTCFGAFHGVGVGCVLVRDRRVLSTGYVGSVRGLPHCVDVGCLLEEEKCVRTVHAEVNAVIQCALHGVDVGGATAYCTFAPCWTCFKTLANAGIFRVVFAVKRDDVEKQEEAACALGVLWECIATPVIHFLL